MTRGGDTSLPVWHRATVYVAVVAAVGFASGQYSLLVESTSRLRDLGYREMGTTEDSEGPMSEQAAAEIRETIGEEQTWALETPKGRCREVSYPYFWLVFYLFPAKPDCMDPDVVVLLGIEPERGADVIVSGRSERLGRSWFLVDAR